MKPSAARGKLRRSVVITLVALKYFVFYRFTSLRNKSLGERLCLACQRLGIIFTKIGQLLSGRYDLLEESDLLELRKLLDQAQPLPDAIVKQIITDELGPKAEQLRELTLLSSASVAQVYQATLNGQEVVVKVLRPQVRAQAQVDLGILLRLILIARKFNPTLKRLKVREAITDMGNWIQEETDLSIELNNIERFRKHLAETFPDGRVRSGLGKIIVPQVYPEWSTSRVLVMERLPGITVSDWLRGVRPKDPKDMDQYDPQMSVKTMFSGSLQPIFQGNGSPFHGDPHSANVVILKHGNVGLIDFGLIGQYDETVIRAANKLFFAIYLKNAEMATTASLQFAHIPLEHYEEILPDMKLYVQKAEQSGFGEWLKGVVQILHKHKLSGPETLPNQQPGHLIAPIMVKFVLLVDSLAHDFFPDKTTADLLGPELEVGIRAQIVYNLKKSRPLATSLGLAYAMSELVAEGPEGVGKIFSQL